MCREAQLIRAWKLLFFGARTFLAQEEGVFSSLNVLLPLYPQTHWTVEKSEFNNNRRSSCILMSSSLKYIVLVSPALCEQNSGKFSQYSRKCGAVHRPDVLSSICMWTPMWWGLPFSVTNFSLSPNCARLVRHSSALWSCYSYTP